MLCLLFFKQFQFCPYLNANKTILFKIFYIFIGHIHSLNLSNMFCIVSMPASVFIPKGL